MKANPANKGPLHKALAIYRSITFSTFLFSFFINMLMFVGPVYMLQIYDRVLQSRSESTLIMLTIISGVLLGAYGLMEFIRSRMLVRAGLRFDNQLAPQLFHCAVKGKLVAPGSNSQFALNDIDRLREFLTGNGLLTFCDAPWAPIFLVICYLFHPLLGLVATSGALIIFSLALANEFLTRKKLGEASIASRNANHFAQSTLQNAEVIRALGMEKGLREKWIESHHDMLKNQAVASDRAGSVLSMSKFTRMFLQVAILGTGAYLVLQQQISPGIMIAASIMMGRALAPVEQAVGQWKQFIGARQAHSRLKSLFNNISTDEEKTALPSPQGRIDVEHLISVIPGTRNTILNGINFHIEPGEVLAIIGPSGAGKSSLARHLVGVWRAVSGKVRIDGAEIEHWSAEKLGVHIGYLPQDVELFSGSIAENICRFRSGDDELIVHAAKEAGVHEMILKMPGGYDTQIGEGGRQLSGGQRQRVGLARALYDHPAFIVLDEPNSNLDQEGETALIQAVQGLKARKCTTIFVTHKASLLSISDKVLVLQDGHMKAFGETEKLLRPQAADGNMPGRPDLGPNPDAGKMQKRPGGS